jgi:MarR family transcriptional regulator, organic hydroperoxide resistance regulator
VYLTDAGKALRGPVEEIWLRIDEELLKGLTPEEREVLSKLLRTWPRCQFHS